MICCQQKSKIFVLLAKAVQLQYGEYNTKQLQKLIDFCSYNRHQIQFSLEFIVSYVSKYFNKPTPLKFNKYFEILHYIVQKMYQFFDAGSQLVVLQAMNKYKYIKRDECYAILLMLISQSNMTQGNSVLCLDTIISIIVQFEYADSIQQFNYIHRFLYKHLLSSSVQGFLLFVILMYYNIHQFIENENNRQQLSMWIKELQVQYFSGNAFGRDKFQLLGFMDKLYWFLQDRGAELERLDLRSYVSVIKEFVQSYLCGGTGLQGAACRRRPDERVASFVQSLLPLQLLEQIFSVNAANAVELYKYIVESECDAVKPTVARFIKLAIQRTQYGFMLDGLLGAIVQAGEGAAGGGIYASKIVKRLFRSAHVLDVCQYFLEHLLLHACDCFIQALIERYMYDAVASRRAQQRRTKLMGLITRFINQHTNYHTSFLDILKRLIEAQATNQQRLYYYFVNVMCRRCIPADQLQYLVFLIRASPLFDVTFSPGFVAEVSALIEGRQIDAVRTTEDDQDIFMLLQLFDNPVMVQNCTNLLKTQQIEAVGELSNVLDYKKQLCDHIAEINLTSIDRPPIRREFQDLVALAFPK